MKNEDINHTILGLGRFLIRAMDQMTSQYGLNGTQSFIIGYIGESKDPIYQKNIEDKLNLRRSTVSEMLTKLENKNLIKRISSKEDARLKQIILTPKSKEITSKIEDLINKNEKLTRSCLTSEEQKQFLNLCHKIYENMKERSI